MRTLGIDLSANPTKTGACRIDWPSLDVAFLPRPVADEELVAAVASSDMTGIDVPLGWPDDFVHAVVGHTTRPPPEYLEVARREGWIHVPTAGVAELAAVTDSA